MRTISVINLKGGVGKTVTSTNLAYQLAQRGSNVLLIDCDKQGNSSKTFNAHEQKPNLADVLLGNLADTKYAITSVVNFENGRLDIIPADMSLLEADSEIRKDDAKPQQIRLREALESVADNYNYCIIDCPPNIDMPVINALTASDDYIIPVTIDRYAFDGIDPILKKVYDIKRYFNPGLELAGCLVTKYINDDTTNTGIEYLKQKYGVVFETKIKRTDMVSKSTFMSQTVIEYSPRSGAAKSYAELAAEYERRVANNG